MRKQVRLSESDMVRLVRKVVNEQQRNMGWNEQEEVDTELPSCANYFTSEGNVMSLSNVTKVVKHITNQGQMNMDYINYVAYKGNKPWCIICRETGRRSSPGFQ